MYANQIDSLGLLGVTESDDPKTRSALPMLFTYIERDIAAQDKRFSGKRLKADRATLPFGNGGQNGCRSVQQTMQETATTKK